MVCLTLRINRLALVQLGMPEIFNKEVEEKKKDSGLLHEVESLKKSGRFNSFWGSMVIAPEKAKFESQNDNEKIILLGRRHFVTNLGWMFMSCLLFFVPLFWSEFPLIGELGANTYFGLLILWYTGLSFYVIQNFILWFYNVYIVTDERIIDIDFFGLMYKNINVTQIRKIEDVNYSQKGILSSFFNFGDVVIQTASEQRSDEVFAQNGEASPFTFDQITNPDKVVRIISELMEQEELEEYQGRIR